MCERVCARVCESVSVYVRARVCVERMTAVLVVSERRREERGFLMGRGQLYIFLLFFFVHVEIFRKGASHLAAYSSSATPRNAMRASRPESRAFALVSPAAFFAQSPGGGQEESR